MRLLAPNPSNGIWYLHLVAEDTMGYLTSTSAERRVLVGPDPGMGTVSGLVTSGGNLVKAAAPSLRCGKVFPVKRELAAADEELQAFNASAFDEAGVDVTQIDLLLSMSPRERLDVLYQTALSLARLMKDADTN